MPSVRNVLVGDDDARHARARVGGAPSPPVPPEARGTRMSPTHAVFTLTMISLVALVGGVADADAPDVDHRGQAIGTIRSIDRAENVVTLGDGLRLRATDAQILDELREGELVKVDFAHESGGWVIRTIEAADANAEPTDLDGD